LAFYLLLSSSHGQAAEFAFKGDERLCGQFDIGHRAVSGSVGAQAQTGGNRVEVVAALTWENPP
jgi:hypothetical protein